MLRESEREVRVSRAGVRIEMSVGLRLLNAHANNRLRESEKKRQRMNA